MLDLSHNSDPTTLAVTDVLASSYGGLPLNSPNDVAVHPSDGSIFYTDPYYGFLSITKAPLGDHNYSSDKSALRFAGVYRVPPPALIGAADPARPQLITAELSRPNGIGFEPASADGTHAMWVSECCQGHAASCPPATARWHRYVPIDAARTNYTRERTIEWRRPDGGGGCADGFKIASREGRSSLLIGSCPLGVCVVDLERGENAVLERVEFGGHRVSNVAFGGDDHLYVTGEGHLWRLPLNPSAFEPLGQTPKEGHWSEAYKEEV